MPIRVNYFGSIARIFYKITLTCKYSREALEHTLANLIKLNSESPIRNNLILNDRDCIEDLVNTADTDTPNPCYKKNTKTF